MSKIKVVSYMSGIPFNNKNLEKPRVLYNFIESVKANGDIGIVHTGFDIIDCDVAVIQGFVHEHGKLLPHLNLRKTVIERQIARGRRSIIIDSNLFLYRDKYNSCGYLRYSYDGVFPNTGEYCNANPDPNRWETIRNNIGFNLKPWRENGKHILICLQRNGGWSMKGLNVVDFFKQITTEIRKYSDRPIIVRTHPGDKRSSQYVNSLIGKNVSISVNEKLDHDLNNAWASVVYNSSPSVASVIEGIPTFVIDPTYSQTAEVANLDISKIETPTLFDRSKWIQKLAQCHWNDYDLTSGAAWKHMKDWAIYDPNSLRF